VYQAVVPSDSNGDDHDPEMCMELLRDVEKHLKTRAAEILQLNPWLASKIIKNTNYTMKAMLTSSKNTINNTNEYGGSGKYAIRYILLQYIFWLFERRLLSL
jgi:hypothetical protein